MRIPIVGQGETMALSVLFLLYTSHKIDNDVFFEMFLKMGSAYSVRRIHRTSYIVH